MVPQLWALLLSPAVGVHGPGPPRRPGHISGDWKTKELDQVVVHCLQMMNSSFIHSSNEHSSKSCSSDIIEHLCAKRCAKGMGVDLSSWMVQNRSAPSLLPLWKV